MFNLKKDEPRLVLLYRGEFGEKVIRNLINDPSFCKSCGLQCDYCKYSVYSYVRNIKAAVELQDESKLPVFIEQPEKYLPKKIPEADLCVASGIHKDLLLELPRYLAQFNVKGLIVPIEDFIKVPSGLRKQVEERCEEHGLESAFPKPFCSLLPNEDKPIISNFIVRMRVGRPLLEISVAERSGHEVIESTVVKRSAPCGSTWYIARKLIGIETTRRILYDSIAKAHHSYPCTATMAIDPKVKEPILHIGGHIIREEVENALTP